MIVWSKHWNKSSEDPTCGVICLCGEYLWVSESHWEECKKCGRAYKNQFICHRIPKPVMWFVKHFSKKWKNYQIFLKEWNSR